ncbi:MAG: GHKL domain-containing protein, partial [Clostridia bacterium]
YLQKLPIYILNVVIHVLFYFMFGILPFRSHYRYSKGRMAVVVSIMLVFFAVTDVLFFESEAPLYAYRALIIAPTIFFVIGIALIFIKKHFFHVCFIAVAIFTFHSGCITLSKSLARAFTIHPLIAWFPEFNYILTTVVVLCVMFIPLMYLSASVLRKIVDEKINFGKFRFTSLLLPMYLLVALIYGIFGEGEIENPFLESLIIIMFIACAYLSYVAIMKMLLSINAEIDASRVIIESNKQIEYNKKNYDKLMEYINESSRERHDFRQSYIAIKGLVESGDIEATKKYFETYDENHSRDDLASVCKNYTIDLVLRHYIFIANSNQIKVTTAINLPAKMSIDDTELCIVFGNLMENAVEACLRQTSGDKFINVKAEIVRKQLIIFYQNSFNGKVEQDGKKFFSSKQSGRYGLGIDSVTKIAEKKDGGVKVDYDDNVFRVYVVINLE